MMSTELQLAVVIGGRLVVTVNRDIKEAACLSNVTETRTTTLSSQAYYLMTFKTIVQSWIFYVSSGSFRSFCNA